jgi:subtilisin family serine protease
MKTRLIINVPRDERNGWRSTIESLRRDAESFNCVYVGTLEESIERTGGVSEISKEYLQQSIYSFVLWETDREDTSRLINQIESAYDDISTLDTNNPAIDQKSRRGFIKYVEKEPKIKLNQGLAGGLLGNNFKLNSHWQNVYCNNLMQLNSAGETGQGIKIAIIDTGVEPAAQGVTGFYDLFSTTNPPFWFLGGNSNAWIDQNGHGTGMTAIIHEIVKDAELYVFRAIEQQVAGLWDVMTAIGIAVSTVKPHIFNLSLSIAEVDCLICGASAFSRNRVFRDFLSAQAKLQKNSDYEPVFVTATGNDGLTDAIHLPAKYDFTLAVAAVDKNCNLTSYSNHGVKPGQTQKDNYVVVPGGDVDNQSPPQPIEFIGTATDTSGAVSHCIGTSPATALATGLLALYMEKYSYPIVSKEASFIIDKALNNCDNSKISKYSVEKHGKGLFVYK